MQNNLKTHIQNIEQCATDISATYDSISSLDKDDYAKAHEAYIQILKGFDCMMQLLKDCHADVEASIRDAVSMRDALSVFVSDKPGLDNLMGNKDQE